jgi:hypothetical protein
MDSYSQTFWRWVTFGKRGRCESDRGAPSPWGSVHDVHPGGDRADGPWRSEINSNSIDGKVDFIHTVPAKDSPYMCESEALKDSESPYENMPSAEMRLLVKNPC